ncbi:MAG TPA: AI-2E family transporter [Steroidobacteraceae bacterium]|nr:AI-2E family transporter [Steroidobacteraceae bacterium]HQX78406.1 AI-2E family transporter [Steroidobacteraceae bacterium]HQZ80096.1 AI-2E family transporter [Steroidobacteraceae bacterium]
MDSVFYRRGFALAATLTVGYLLWRIFAPFTGAIVWAAFLAFMLHPLHQRLTRRLKGRAALSAGLITLLTPLAILAPLSILGGVFAAQAAELAARAQGFFQRLGAGGLAELQRYPLIGRPLAWLEVHAGFGEAQLREWLLSGGQSFLKWGASLGGNVVVGALGTAVGFGIAIVLLYFFVRDGVAWSTRVIRLIPMEPVRRSGLIAHLAQVTRAVVFGSGATALLQGIAVGIGFAIAGLPTYVVFGVLTALLSLLPMGGAALVWVPGMLYLAAAGRWGMAVFLLIWGVGVSFGDNVVRPLLVSRHAEVSTLTVFIGVLGGAAAFGAIGLIVGPLVLTLAKALLDYMDEMLVRPA